MELGKERGYVFIDEIQQKENAGLFLKGLFDLKLPYKFIVSGSGSLELKEKIHESLVGRKRLFELTKITFDEFVHHKTGYKYKGNLAEFLAIEKDKVLFACPFNLPLTLDSGTFTPLTPPLTLCLTSL